MLRALDSVFCLEGSPKLILCHLELAGALVHQREGLKNLGVVGVHFLRQFEFAFGVFPVPHANILPGERPTLIQRSVRVRGHLCPAAAFRDATVHQTQQHHERSTAQQAEPAARRRWAPV